MKVDGKEEMFSHIGEETFQEELAKKTLARQMKEVKKQMIQVVTEECNGCSYKFPKSMVKIVILLLLQPGALRLPNGPGGEENYTQENMEENGGDSSWNYIKVFLLYTFLVLFGMYGCQDLSRLLHAHGKTCHDSAQSGGARRPLFFTFLGTG